MLSPALPAAVENRSRHPRRWPLLSPASPPLSMLAAAGALWQGPKLCQPAGSASFSDRANAAMARVLSRARSAIRAHGQPDVGCPSHPQGNITQLDHQPTTLPTDLLPPLKEYGVFLPFSDIVQTSDVV